jgi:ADP-ribose pyrophosphatase
MEPLPANPDRIERRSVHRGRIVDLGIDRVRFPDGTTGELEMIHHSGAAAVLPVLDDGHDPRIVLVRQYRYAAGGTLLEVPAGRPDAPGEPWDVCARRELREETGMEAEELTPLTSIWTTPGFTDERIHLFLARGLTRGETSYHPDEFMETVELSLSEAIERIRTGEISDGKTVCTLLFAGAFLLDRGAVRQSPDRSNVLTDEHSDP